jgi:hypothetical protein
MIGSDDLSDLVSRFEMLLADLDRLNLPVVAVHVDLALRLLEEATGLAKSVKPGSVGQDG